MTLSEDLEGRIMFFRPDWVKSVSPQQNTKQTNKKHQQKKKKKNQSEMHSLFCWYQEQKSHKKSDRTTCFKIFFLGCFPLMS